MKSLKLVNNLFCKNEKMHNIPCSEHVNSALMKNGKKRDKILVKASTGRLNGGEEFSHFIRR